MALSRRWSADLKAFLSNRAGNIAALFALSFVPLTMSAGVAIDFTRAEEARTGLKKALDSAALGALAQNNPSEDQIKASVQSLLKANDIGPAVTVTGLAVDYVSGRLNLQATAAVETTLLATIGKSEIAISAESEAAFGTRPVEIALVIDNTGSVYHANIDEDLKDAVRGYINQVEAAYGTSGQARLSLIPYMSFVNIRGTDFDWAWMDTTAQSSIHGEPLDLEFGETVFDLFDEIPNAEWMGCVMARPGIYGYSDIAPTGGDGDSLFVPLFVPDEPDHWNDTGVYETRAVNYLPDLVSSSGLSHDEVYENIVRDTTKYNGTPYTEFTPGSGNGPNFGCSPHPIIPLTDDFDEIRTAVDALSLHPGIGTNTAEGAMWGLRTLSPGAPYTQGSDYGSGTDKILVIFTDGINHSGGHDQTPREPTTGSTYIAYGYAREGRVSGTDDDDVRDEIDNLMLEACDLAKDNGVKVMTIVYNQSNSVNDLFANCSSDEDTLTFTPRNPSELESAFTLVGVEQGALRLVK